MFILIYGTLARVAAFLFTKFPFGRAEHEARLAGLAAAENEGVPHVSIGDSLCCTMRNRSVIRTLLGRSSAAKHRSS